MQQFTPQLQSVSCRRHPMWFWFCTD